MTDSIDWGALREAATDAMTKAYVPYSKFPVGVAAIVTDGRIITGCNVENASYGLTLCAECALVSMLHLTGGGQLVAFTCVDGDGNLQDFSERFERMVSWQERRHPEQSRADLESATLDYMATLPAWRAHPRVVSRS